MENGMEMGIVKFFNEKKGFGFMLVKGKEDVFFHINNYKKIEQGNEHPRFCKTYERRRIMPKILPKNGDALVFERFIAPRADAWGFKCDYQRVEKDISTRPTYRITQQYSVPGRTVCEPTIIWEDSNIVELHRKYPCKPRNFSCDDFDVVYRFYRLDNKIWVECDFPL